MPPRSKNPRACGFLLHRRRATTTRQQLKHAPPRQKAPMPELEHANVHQIGASLGVLAAPDRRCRRSRAAKTCIDASARRFGAALAGRGAIFGSRADRRNGPDRRGAAATQLESPAPATAKPLCWSMSSCRIASDRRAPLSRSPVFHFPFPLFLFPFSASPHPPLRDPPPPPAFDCTARKLASMRGRARAAPVLSRPRRNA